jgi:hypothetical protein
MSGWRETLTVASLLLLASVCSAAAAHHCNRKFDKPCYGSLPPYSAESDQVSQSERDVGGDSTYLPPGKTKASKSATARPEHLDINNLPGRQTDPEIEGLSNNLGNQVHH